jgi:FkbM family methyltransferase
MSAPIPLRIPGLPRPLQLQVHGEGDRVISERIRRDGCWEPYETALLLELLRPGQVFVDVGANIGYFSVIAASVVGQAGAVFAFEPGRDNAELLRANAALNDCPDVVTVVQAGLALDAGRGQLFLSEDNAGDHRVFASQPGRRSEPITLLNGSDYLRGRLSRIDLLKVDVQGAEYAAMAGLMPLLEELNCRPRILLELTPLSLREAGRSGRQLIELLARLQQPMYIVDHIEHRLVACAGEELARWCDEVDAAAGDAGFMNILVGSGP